MRSTTRPALFLAAALPLAGAACSRTSEPDPAPAAPAVAPDVSARFVDAAGRRVRVRECGPGDGPPVLLLHGARFTSATWEENGTLTRLGAEGLHAVALDLPGHGESAANDLEPVPFLDTVLDALGLGPVVLVAPSMSGRFAFPFVAERPERVSGFVPVAPAAVEEHEDALRGSPVRTLVVWGTADDVVPVAGAESLGALFSDAEVLTLDGAGHPAYLDRPEAFHDALVRFATSSGGRGR